ncbi:MAG: RNA-binding protein [Pseudomonadota bacterium]
MGRGGRAKERDGPERRCIVTGESGGTAGLVRFVIGPEATIFPDVAERLPGRGIWVSAERDKIERAVAKRLFSRAARAEVRVDEDLADRVETLLAERLIDRIAMARKAGQAVAGNEKVRARLAKGPVGALIEASDGSEQGLAKLRPLAGNAPRITVLAAGELGLAFARDRVIHAALDAGGLTDGVLRDAARLSGLRLGSGCSGDTAGGMPVRKD